MINLYATQIEEMFLHKVGNKSRNEELILSEKPYALDDEMHSLLKEYFLKAFREKEEYYYKFTHEVDLEFNEIHTAINNALDGSYPTSLDITSKIIAKHLYNQANHPHIKSGELYVCYLENMMFDNERVNGIGIFKSEIKQDFLQFKDEPDQIKAILQKGVNLQKLDKGAIIFNTEKEDGYRILTIDQNKYDTKYWLENFLGLQEAEDANFYTKNYLDFCRDFAKNVVLPAEDKQEEIMFMNRAVNHFASNDEFQEDSFLNEVIENPSLIPEFKNYKEEKAPKYKVEDISEFSVSNQAVNNARKKFKSVIELDTNVTIKMDFINPESAQKYIEKGWDEERQMYYYLVYFNSENQ
jgi:hypothetical protein